jgi:hypothetical protein
LPLHEPQLSVPPQPLLGEPQFAPTLEHVAGWQQTFGVIAPQIAPAGHAWQLTLPPPHGFGKVPHLPVQLGVAQPQTFGVPPPPHVSGEVQVPQSSTPAQPSDTCPQFFPSDAHV